MVPYVHTCIIAVQSISNDMYIVMSLEMTLFMKLQHMRKLIIQCMRLLSLKAVN